MEKYSVLMSVYHKETASYFDTAINSMLQQSVSPSDFVIVCDGPLTDELDEVIKKYESNPIFNIVRLEENQGLGNALMVGLSHCKYEFVLRMDSDDISFPDRAEIELKVLNEGFDIVGGYISEFYNDDPNNVAGIRKVRLVEKDIIEFAKTRSPFNHPSVAFRKSSIDKAGGYLNFPFLEDWYLWIRCILANLRMANVDKVLVNMRSGYLMRARRGGKQYRKSLKRLFKFMRKNKLIGPFKYLSNITKYRLYSIMPLRFKAFLTDRLLRKKK